MVKRNCSELVDQGTPAQRPVNSAIVVCTATLPFPYWRWQASATECLCLFEGEIEEENPKLCVGPDDGDFKPSSPFCEYDILSEPTGHVSPSYSYGNTRAEARLACQQDAVNNMMCNRACAGKFVNLQAKEAVCCEPSTVGSATSEVVPLAEEAYSGAASVQ